MSELSGGTRNRSHTTLRLLGAIGLVGFCGVAFTPLPNVLSQWMRLDQPVERTEAIVVLGGGGVRGDGALTDTSLRRLAKGLDLYRQGVAPLLVISGVKSETGDEALARSEFARSCGIAATAIVTESGTHTTREEATRLAARLIPRGVRTIALVVDAQGTRRASAAFRRVGFTVVPVSANDVDSLAGRPESRLMVTRRILLEATALVYYRLAGYL